MRSQNSAKPEPISIWIGDIPAATGATRTATYDAIAKGLLKTFKIGRRRYARTSALHEWINSLERASGGAK